MPANSRPNLWPDGPPGEHGRGGPALLEQAPLDAQIALRVFAEVADERAHLRGQLVEVLVGARVVGGAAERALARVDLARDFADVGESLLDVLVELVLGDELAEGALAGLDPGHDAVGAVDHARGLIIYGGVVDEVGEGVLG